MKERTMSYENSLRDARIFLNTFNLILEDGFSEKLDIYDKDGNIVGCLSLIDNRINISAEYNGILLEADYYLPKMIAFVDIEDNDQLFGQWSSEIYFVLKKEKMNINGEFLLSSSMDSEFGSKCVCHPIIRCDLDELGKIEFEILRKGKMFGLSFKTYNLKESIEVRPFDDLNGYIKHDILYGEYDFTRSSFPYRRYSGVFTGGESEKDKLHVFLHEEKYRESLDFKNGFVDKVNGNMSSDAIIQKGNLMKELDPDMYKKIKILCEILKIEDFSLLDNLISVCYDSYTDEELFALLDIERKKIVYQTGENKLRDAYFSDNCKQISDSSLKLLK